MPNGPSYYRARYYDSSVGRFNSEDPIAFNGEINFYRYAHNGPVDNSDPLGLTTYNGFPADLEVQMRNAVNEALSKLRSHCRYSSCNGVDGPKVADAIENATFIYKPKQKDCGFVGPASFVGFRHQVGIGPSAFTPDCCSLASTIAHEAVHLTKGNDDKAYDLEEKCFGCKRPVKQ